MAKKKPETIYQIRISLDHIRPPIWRRVFVPGKYTLGDLHQVIQVAMGWQFSHLHAFTISDLSFCPLEEMEFDAFDDMEDEDQYHIKDVVEEGSRFHYEYDFGDSWEHTLLVEKVFPAEEGQVVPVCIKGKRACPPEDVGGFPGYLHLLEVMANPDDPESESYLEWMGGPFDPEAFDIAEVNRSLASFGSDGWSQLTAQSIGLDAEETQAELVAIQKLKEKVLDRPYQEEIKSLPMLGMMISMLRYIRDNKVTGTKVRGDFPRKAVRAMIEQSPFGEVFQDMTGNAPEIFRTEEEVAPVYYAHVMATVEGLIAGGPDQQWQVTPDGEAFLNDDPRIQLGRLFVAWWYKMDWMVIVPVVSSIIDSLDAFRLVTYQSLMSLPVDQDVSFQQFVQPFLKDLDLPAGFDRNLVDEFLASFLEAVILVPLHGLGIIQMVMEEFPPDSVEIPKIKAVKLTPLGKDYLSFLPIA